MGPPHSRGPWPLGFAFLLKSALAKLLAMFPDIMAACLQVAALTPGLPSDLCPGREKQQQVKPVTRGDMPGAGPQDAESHTHMLGPLHSPLRDSRTSFFCWSLRNPLQNLCRPQGHFTHVPPEQKAQPPKTLSSLLHFLPASGTREFSPW